MTYVNRVFNHSCEAMPEIPDGSVHLVVTSPPYDGIRTYGGVPEFDAMRVMSEIARVLCDGGVACWVVQDQTKDFAKSDSSFRQALQFVDAGLRRFETIIYQRHGRPGAWWSQRLRVDHEYCHVFFRGDRPRTFHKPLVPSKWAGVKWHGTQRLTSGETTAMEKHAVVADDKCRGTIWDYGLACSENNTEKAEHPATFPDALASDLIQAFSDEGDIVLDPFMGSGTTAVMAEVLRRRWTGYEINPTYYDLILRRTAQRSLFGESA